MAHSDLLNIVVYLGLVMGLSIPLGLFIGRVLNGENHILSKPLGWLERGVLKLCGVQSTEMEGLLNSPNFLNQNGIKCRLISEIAKQ